MANYFHSAAPAFVLGACLTVLMSLLVSWRGGGDRMAPVDCEQQQQVRSEDDELLVSAGPGGSGRVGGRSVSIFCLVMVPLMMPIYHMMFINGSWGRRCDDFAFVAPRESVGDVDVPVMNVNVMTTDRRQFHKVEWQRVWHSAWQLHTNGTIDKFDYFFLVRTANYIIVENLRYLVRSERPSEAAMFGRRMRGRRMGGDEGDSAEHLAADAGILLSRGALDALVRRGFSGVSASPATRRYCSADSVTESYDIQLSQCLLSLGVAIKDSRDSRGRERFHPVHPADLIDERRMPAWLRNGSYYRPVKACLSCASAYSVSFFGVKELHKTDAMIYHVRPLTGTD